MNVFSTIAAALVTIAAVVGVVWLTGDNVTPPLPEAQPEAEATDKPVLEVSPNPPWPNVVVVGGNEHDFGRMSVGETRTHKFTLKNTGDAPLKLKLGETTCKCTLSDLAKDLIPPGESVEVELEWTPKGPSSMFRQFATVHTNDPNRTNLNLNIMGYVDYKLEVHPSDEWRIQSSVNDKPSVVTGEIFSTVVDKFEILEASTDSEDVEVAYEPLSDSRRGELSAKHGYKVTVTVQPPKKAGQFVSRVQMKTTVPGFEKIEYKVNYQRTGPIHVTPYESEISSPGVTFNQSLFAMDMGQFSSKDGCVGQFSLIGRHPDGDFQITGAEKVIDNFDLNYFEVITELDPRTKGGRVQRYIVTLRVKPGAPKGKHIRPGAPRILLKTNHPDVNEVKVYVEFIIL